jgi:NAD(P)-dependent dehydrogenase (short-subunit alcohol dehydrogenase family)
MEESRKVALVTNASDYAGPPAVNALAEANFRVLVHDDTFEDEEAWASLSSGHPRAELIRAGTPDELASAAWDTAGLRCRPDEDRRMAAHGMLRK